MFLQTGARGNDVLGKLDLGNWFVISARKPGAAVKPDTRTSSVLR